MRFNLKLLALLIIIPATSHALENVDGAERAYWIWGGAIPERVNSANTLYVYQGVFDIVHNRAAYRFEGPPPRSMAGYHDGLTLTYRLEKLVPPDMVISRFLAHQHAWKKHGILTDGIQIDYDSPTMKLLEYADWLVLLKNAVGGSVQISITGLGDWLVSAPSGHLKDLSSRASFIAFMMYHGGRPLKRLKSYTEPLAKLALPFKIGRLEIQKHDKTFENIFQAPGYQGEIVFILPRRVHE